MNLNSTNQLATYNAEISRGIVHTAEYDRKMKRLQKEYNEEINTKIYKVSNWYERYKPAI
jgi:lysyl-tRNA synthetase class I